MRKEVIDTDDAEAIIQQLSNIEIEAEKSSHWYKRKDGIIMSEVIVSIPFALEDTYDKWYTKASEVRIGFPLVL